MKTLLVLFLCSAAALTHAADLTPAAGPHRVGLRVIQQYDYSRVMDEQADAFGKIVQPRGPRPLQTLVWYPARPGAAPAMKIMDYRQLVLSELNFAPPPAEVAWQRAAWLASPQKAVYGAATPAVRDAAPAGGTYPVVVYAPSFAATAVENVDLCEYLASQGYVVLASRSLGARTAVMTDDVEGAEAQAADIAFLLNTAQTLPQADLRHVAAVGFSWGGLANVLAAARYNRIDALVSLDGSIRFHPKVWRAAGYLRPVRTAVPMLSFGSFAPPAEELERSDKLGPSYLNTMKYSDVYIGTMHPMRHQHFSSWGLRFSGDDAFGDFQRGDVLQAYRSAALYVHRFLDAYLKGDGKARAFLQEPPVKHGIAPQVMALSFRPAAQAVVTEADFLRTFAAGGYRDAVPLYTRLTASSPDFALSPVNLNTLGYQLLAGHQARGAVELFRLATHIEPQFANAFDSEGEAWEAVGDKAQAIAAYEKAVAADPQQTNALARIRTLRGDSR